VLQNAKETYEREQRISMHILQREKWNFLNGLLEEADKNLSKRQLKEFFQDYQETSAILPA